MTDVLLPPEVEESEWHDYLKTCREQQFTEWNEEDHPRHPAGSPQGGEFAPKGVRVLEVGKDFPDELLHGTKRSNLKSLLGARDESSKRESGNPLLDVLAPPVQNEFKSELLLSEPSRPQQANMWSQGRGNTLAVVKLRPGAKILDLTDEATRTPVLTLGSEPSVLRFFSRPAITDDLINYRLSRVVQGYKDRFPDWQERIRAETDPMSKTFSVDSWREHLVSYAKARGYAAVRLADEVLVADRSVMVGVREASKAEKRAATMSPPDLKGNLFAKAPLSQLKKESK